MALVIVSAAAFAFSILTLFSGFGLGTLLTPVLPLFLPLASAVAETAMARLADNAIKFVLLGQDAH